MAVPIDIMEGWFKTPHWQIAKIEKLYNSHLLMVIIYDHSLHLKIMNRLLQKRPMSTFFQN